VQTTPCAEQQRQERLVRRAGIANKRAAKATPPPFQHQPVAPYVPKEAVYASQRSFSRGNETRCVDLIGAKPTFDFDTPRTFAEVSVFRWTDKDKAEIILRVGAGRSESSATVECNAAELREIAARILDAAHDLEMNPSASLSGRAA